MKEKTKRIKCISDKSCNGNLVLKRVDYTLKHNGRTIVVPKVEIWECDTCKERFYPYEASKKIDLYKEYSGRLTLRINPKLHWKLIRLAKKHHRSLNQEISYLLEDSAQ